MPLPSLPWPLPALLVWGGAWLLYAGAQSWLAWWWAALLAVLFSVCASLWGRTWWRRVLLALGFPLSFAVLAAGSLPAWGWLLLLGALLDKLSPLLMSLLIYCGMLASLLALGCASSFPAMLLSGFVAGLFATGGQSVLYALAPLFYRTEIRATGVGTAVAVGRLGAMSGPLLAGKMLALGAGTANAANTLVVPARAIVNLGARYKFKIDKTPALVRFNVSNVTNTFGFNVSGSGAFTPNGSRRYALTLAADI